MYENLINLKAGRTELVQDSMIYPLLRWCSGDIEDLMHCVEVNRHFFYLPQRITKEILAYNIKSKHVCKYPKSSFQEDKKLIAFLPYIKTLYKYSEKDLKKQIEIINRLFKHTEYIEYIDKLCGMKNNDLKIFGIKSKKIDIPDVKKESKVDHRFW